MSGPALFVYWRADATRLPLALAAARQAHIELRELHPALKTGLFERIGDTPTLMETYAMPAGIDAELQSAIEVFMSRAMTPWSLGPRHVEVFEAR